MRRQDLLLAMLAAGHGRQFEPVHVQKAMFLLDDKLAGLFDADSRYHFAPYDYGPYDAAVYADLDVLERAAQVLIARDPGYRYRRYQLTEQGLAHGQQVLNGLQAPKRGMFQRIADFVLSLDFRTLVSAIYQAYPHMRENSIFRDSAP